MVGFLKGAALAVVMSALSSTCWADEANDLRAMEKSISNTGKTCVDLMSPLKQDNCVWDKPELSKTCKGKNPKTGRPLEYLCLCDDPADGDVELICEADDLKITPAFTEEDYTETLKQFMVFLRDKEGEMIRLIDDFKAGKGRYKTLPELKNAVSAKEKELGTGCRNMANGIAGHLKTVFELYAALGGGSCKFKRPSPAA